MNNIKDSEGTYTNHHWPTTHINLPAYSINDSFRNKIAIASCIPQSLLELNQIANFYCLKADFCCALVEGCVCPCRSGQ